MLPIVIFGVFSDVRLKKDIEDIDVWAGAEKLEKVRLVSYELRDSIEEGGRRFEGVLAQELERVDRSMVSYRKGYIPNVYAFSRVLSQGSGEVVLELSRALSGESAVKKGDRLKLYVMENALKQVELRLGGVGGSYIRW